MNKKIDFAVFIGRFQPLHNGHMFVIGEALRHAERVIVLIGSANASRSPRNPFTYAERQAVLLKAFNGNPRLSVRPLNDHTYNDNAWIAEVQKIVNTTVNDICFMSTDHSLRGKSETSGASISLVGYGKDSSSYYIKMFPQWGSININSQFKLTNSTEIRDEYFRAYSRIPDRDHVPEEVAEFMRRFTYADDFKWLVNEFDHVRHYKKIWSGSPFPVVITCVDAIVVQSGHILLVERKDHPGKGLLALPGGHVNPKETFLDAAIRELREETHIADEKGEIPPAMLKSFIDDKKTRLFDDPYRSARARVITNAYYFELPNRKKLFEVRGDDDAVSAKWYPLGSLDAKNFFEDHFHIIKAMTA